MAEQYDEHYAEEQMGVEHGGRGSRKGKGKGKSKGRGRDKNAKKKRVKKASKYEL